jgi:hypothetical protein|nr:MAG TPA: hypothetical protein [Caudoviricetes sp.]
MNEEEARETLKTMKENIDKKYLKTRNSVAIETVLKLLEKKDKIIDLMGEKIFEEGIVWENKEEVKQYFENEAKERR